jgi:hypothetical protein
MPGDRQNIFNTFLHMVLISPEDQNVQNVLPVPRKEEPAALSRRSRQY